MRLALVVHLIGTLVRLFSPTVLVPAAVAAFYREWFDAAGFIVAFSATAVVGTLMRRAAVDRRCRTIAACRGDGRRVDHLAGGCQSGRDPVPLGRLQLRQRAIRVDVGLTTTGATVVTDFSAIGRGVFFWRP